MQTSAGVQIQSLQFLKFKRSKFALEGSLTGKEAHRPSHPGTGGVANMMADGLESGRESIGIRYRWLYTWLGANLPAANLPSANLPAANLLGANLPGANLQVCTCGEA
jgi:hypothetical protein